MERVGIRELRNHSARWVRRAAAGERIVITVDGTPTAQLGPLEAPAGAVTVEDLAARGLIQLAGRADRPPPEFVMPLWAGTRLDQLVGEVRGR